MKYLLGLAMISAVGCTGKPGPDGETDTEDTDLVETDEPAVSSPCTEESWGLLGDPADAIHVRTDGSATGAGDASDPVDSLATALALAQSAGLHAIFVGPGTFPTNVVLDERDDDLRLLGCPGESTLEADNVLDPVLKVSATTGLLVDGLDLSGARRSLWVWQGASVEFAHGRISDGRRIAVLVDGDLTALTLTEAEVEGPETETSAAGVVGYGVVVQNGTLTMAGGTVTGATGVGIFAESATVSLTDVDVSDTLSLPDGTLGRAVHVQNNSTATITGGTLSGNADAAIFALRATSLVVTGTTITGTAAAVTPLGTATGDGIVVTAGDSDFAPSSFLATLSGNLISENDRAGILIEGSSVEATSLAGNTYTDNGYEPDGMGAVVQSAAIAPVSDGFYDCDSEGIAPLDINILGLIPDPLD